KFENIGVVIISENGNVESNYLISAESLTDDQNVVKKINEIKERIENLYGQVIAKSEIQFDGAKETNRAKETNSGDIITDAMIWYASRNSDIFEVPLEDVVALENGGAIRDAIPKGDVTKKDLLAVFPFGNTVSAINVKGSELLELLEAATFSLPDNLGAYPQTAGIKFTVDCTIEYDAGELYPGTTYNRPNSIQRVTIESINGNPFDINKTYALVTNDFLAAGGDTAYILGEKAAYETGKVLDELLEEYITEELGGVLTAEKYGNSRGDQTLIFDKKSDDTETTEKETKDEITTEMNAAATENVIADDYNGFIDVKGMWFENIVNTLHDLGLVNGRTEELFAPNDNLTRAELVQLFANLSGADLSAYANAVAKFTDFETNVSYYSAVMWASYNNIVYGIGNDSFAPDTSITREDTAEIIYRYLGIEAAAENNSFADTNEISAYASDAVNTLSAEGIINGYPDNTFRPKNTITRAEAASVLYGVNER
ncbi:MAG: S-layer homology domain-containing protein, partial [Firmicutes bacterium]|nr:S-layer homology domain-containing protein [Bacillota bacterium]